jgi:hypothetical protein
MSHYFFQNDGMNTLTFPISSERLANIRTECDELQREKFIKLTIDNMSQIVIKEAYNRKKFAQLYLNSAMVPRVLLPTQITVESQLPEILKKLRERFTGCEITIDPMKTYIYISW